MWWKLYFLWPGISFTCMHSLVMNSQLIDILIHKSTNEWRERERVIKICYFQGRRTMSLTINFALWPSWSISIRFIHLVPSVKNDPLFLNPLNKAAWLNFKDDDTTCHLHQIVSSLRKRLMIYLSLFHKSMKLGTPRVWAPEHCQRWSHCKNNTWRPFYFLP